MPLRIIGAGFGRTGTLSLFTALNQLGFPCYHMSVVLKSPPDLDFWHEVANSVAGAQHDWERVFLNYTAAVDYPAAGVWRELLVAYPEAKVVLTLHPRGADAWYNSVIDTIYFTENLWQFKLLEFFSPFARKLGDMARKLVWQRSLKGTMNDREKAIARYHQHIAEVKAAVPADQLLVFSVDQGWEPLCKFLGLPPPKTEFPNVNDRAEVKKGIKEMTRGAYVILGVGGALLAGLLYGAFRFF